jgi:hypothetical protein
MKDDLIFKSYLEDFLEDCDSNLEHDPETVKNAKIICAFPACGKSYFFKNAENVGISCIDSDSSNFKWVYGYYNNGTTKIKNPDFPNNYIKHIKDSIGKYDFIFVSTHKEVREALRKADLKYILVYPELDLLEEWVGRCYLRGEDNKFPIDLLVKNWNDWILDMMSEVDVEYYRLKHGQHLSDIIYKLL